MREREREREVRLIVGSEEDGEKNFNADEKRVRRSEML